MNKPAVFYPVKRFGLILHSIIAVLLAGGGGVMIWLAIDRAAGAFVVVYLFAALVLLVGLPFIIYRIVALQRASYVVEREGLTVHWGLRRLVIPFSELEWIRPIGEMDEAIEVPMLSMPGAYLGTSRTPELGDVEFIASDANSMVVIASFDHVYVLSPQDPEKFIHTFERTLEMGTISPIEAASTEPVEFLRSVWSNRFARTSLIVATVLTLLLIILTSLSIPLRETVSMGIDATGQPLAAVASKRLLLLPVLGGIALVLNLVVGLFFYHRGERRVIPYAIWSAAILTPFLLTLALLLIVF
jgi:hypothetical protein